MKNSGMCMKTMYMFLILICPGPDNPKRKIDVYMQPLIGELKILCEVWVQTYDVSRGEHFDMKAALMWTINDFPAYRMLSGYSMPSLLGCPIYVEHYGAKWLKHRRKISYFDCHSPLRFYSSFTI